MKSPFYSFFVPNKFLTSFGVLLAFSVMSTGWCGTKGIDDKGGVKKSFGRDAWCNVLEIVEGEKSDYFKVLEKFDRSSDLVQIDSLLSVWLVSKDFETRPDTPHENEWYSEMENRLEFCLRNCSEGQDQIPFEDLRVRAVLLNGVPVRVNIVDTECWHPVKGHRPATSCPTVEMVFRGGLRMAFQSDRSGAQGWRLIPHQDDMSLIGSAKDRIAHANRKLQENSKPHVFTTVEQVALFPDVKEKIRPTFALTSFPNGDGTFSLWAVSAVSAEQLKSDSSNSVRFTRRDVIYERASGVPRIEVVDSSMQVFAAAEEKSRALYPTYRFFNLNGGEYNYTLSYHDDDGGLGIVTQDFSLPSNIAAKGISDILLTQGLAEQQYGKAVNRVVRNGWVMKANSYPVYYFGDTLYFYAEAEFSEAGFKKDESGKYQYRAYCNLLPAEKSRREASTRTEELYMLRDSIETKYVEKLIRGRHKAPAETNLIYSVSQTTRNAKQVIHDGAALPKISKGEYFLVMRIDDALSPASLIALKTVFIK